MSFGLGGADPAPCAHAAGAAASDKTAAAAKSPIEIFKVFPFCC